MSFFDFLSLLGGLALFLYGMEMLGDGLSMATGGKLEKVLEKLTSNPLKAVVLGALTTAVIQSSSATTVMVVGLVNSGIVQLEQAVGVIMGANIGTTITSWILSLAGLKSDNFFVNLLNPSNFSAIVAIIGIGMILFAKKEKKKNIGTIMIGFAILMYGMEAMSSAVKPLADVPEFRNLFTMFENPILGMIVGLVVTSIIQSSSASVGILEALCMTGTIKFASAIPIIMGQNIGTCVTALLSAIGSGKNGKRAAFVHLYFNLIGTVIFMVAFYTVNMFVNFSFMNHAATPVGIAVIHSSFNIAATLVLLPFAKGLQKLATMTVRDKHDEDSLEKDKFHQSLKLLDELFLERPAFAMEQCKAVVEQMARLTQKCVRRSIEVLENYSDTLYEKIVVYEDDIDIYEDSISTYLVKLSTKDLPEEYGKNIATLLHVVSDYERISDHAYNIAQTAKHLQDKEMQFSEFALKELEVYSAAVQSIVERAFECYSKNDEELAKTIEPLEEVIDDLSAELKERHIQRLVENKCSVEVGFMWSDLLTDFERIADHCSNIAINVLEIRKDMMNMHEYVIELKSEENSEFRNEYKEYREKYKLPKEA